MEILSLYPSLKETIWGGTTLIDDFGFETKNENIAEAWLLSCHDDGPSYVLNGKYKGLTLKQVIEKEGKSILGENNSKLYDFPILIKIIDARDKLSVQVHPDNEYARVNEKENGKTEAWYILDCKENASLIYGMKNKISKDQFRASIENGTLLQNVNEVKVKKGDVVFIPAGMLHAIGAGILLAEVQQSSNSTYRVYDYKRKDKNNNERELHIEKALDVVDLSVSSTDFSPKGEVVNSENSKTSLLTECEYFSMKLIEISQSEEFIADKYSFVSLLVLEGEGEIICNEERLELKRGSSIFVPADKGKYIIKGKLSILETRT